MNTILMKVFILYCERNKTETFETVVINVSLAS